MKIIRLFSGIIIIAGLLSCEKENLPPVASFTVDPLAGNNETLFTFDASASSDPDDTKDQLLIRWDWEGDGFFDTQYAANRIAEHMFSEPGEYLVTLVVKDSRGLTDTLKQALSVQNANQPPLPPSNPNPENESGELGVNIFCSWECIDPEGDMILYTVYFGATNPPEKLLNNHTFNSFDPGKLDYGTTYYWKVDARDSEGHIVEGPVWKFSTIGLNFSTLTDPRDGKSYATIEIGSQWWMAENLNYNIAGGSYCYQDLESNCIQYGRLYKWEAAMSACPDGWHLPGKSELEVMLDYLGGAGVAGGKLKDYETRKWQNPNTGANNLSGFGALPGGRRYGDNNYSGIKLYAQFFSSTEFNSAESYNMMLGYDYEKAYIYNYKKDYAISVRCIKN